MTWLETNNAALISDLTIFVDATDAAPSPQQWCVLFDKLQREATNIQNLGVYWDAEGPIHIRLGKSVVFIRGLAQLKGKGSVDIGGFYAKHWPKYLEEKMGWKPINKDIFPGSSWEGFLRKYQRGTEHRNPWIDTKDGVYEGQLTPASEPLTSTRAAAPPTATNYHGRRPTNFLIPSSAETGPV
jgi:hypothetical protein